MRRSPSTQPFAGSRSSRLISGACALAFAASLGASPLSARDTTFAGPDGRGGASPSLQALLSGGGDDSGGHDGEDGFELRGIASGFNYEALTFRLGAILVQASATTEVLDNRNNPIAFADLVAGPVEVKGRPGTPGTFIATKIKQENGTEIEVHGPIAAISPEAGTFTLGGGLIIQTTPTTQFLDDNNNPVGFGAFTVGSFIEAQGTREGNILTASKVKIEDRNDDDNFAVEFRGRCEAIDYAARTLRVGNQNVVATTGTRILDDNNNPIAFADLALGQFLEVEGARLANGTIDAMKIKQDDGPGDGGAPGFSIEFRAELREIADGTLLVGNRIVRTTPTTLYFGYDNEPITAADLAVGEFLEVEGRREPDGSVTATRIKKEDRVGFGFEFRARLTGIDGTALLLGPARVETTATTVYLNSSNQPITFGDLAVGQLLEVEGNRLSDGTLVARKVKQEDGNTSGCAHLVEFSGPIATIDVATGVLSIGSRVVLVDGNTKLKDAAGNTITLDQFKAGDLVKVEGNFNAEGDVIACELKKRLHDGNGGDPGTTRIFGDIGTIDTAALTFTIGDVTVEATAETEIRSRRGRVLAFSDLQPGFTVLVRGRALGNGRFAARRIRVMDESTEPEGPIGRTHGVVSAADLPTSMTIGNKTILLTANPEVRSFENTPITVNDLGVGDFLEVRGTVTGDNTITAASIRVRGSVLESIDLATQTLSVGAVDVSWTTATIFLERGAGPIAPEDLAVGDLLKVSGTRTATGIDARRIERLSAIRFSRSIPGFTATVPSVEDGRPQIRSTDNQRTFGFVETSGDSFAATPNFIYEVTARISTDIASRSQVPVVRLRANNQSFQKGALVNIDSQQDGRFSPVPAGTEYKFYFAPALPPANATAANDDWFTSMDLLNVGGQDAANASLRLDAIRTRAIPVGKVRSTAVLARYDFTEGSEGWYSGGAPGFFTEAISRSGLTGTLDLAQVDTNTFGFWTGDTGVVPQSGGLYRGRFLVRSASSDPSRVPSFRVRLNLSSFQLAGVAAVESIGSGEESPDAEGRYYDVYLHIPGSVVANDSILASFDLLGFFDDDDRNVPISLDSFTLEKVVIDP
jgi:hypothetical protein